MKKISDEDVRTLVETEHFIHGKSLRSIERDNGLSNDVLRKRCLKLGIKTRSRIESIRANQKYIVPPSGDSHWRKRNIEASHRLALVHSENMKKNNPSNNPATKKKIAESLAVTLASTPTFHEQMFKEFLESNNMQFYFQMLIGPYIADFLIDDVIVELDGRGHASRLASDRVRDKALTDRGFYVVRINQDSLFNKRAKMPVFRPYKLMTILKQLLPSSDIPSGLIPDTGKYRVIVREAYTGIETIY